ncbi:MAG: hypothetical protein JW763_08375 [candidate division Zixibacteria bacterium]|nr:hypothetical protein [candidate division Zixibacteria bacterium]
MKREEENRELLHKFGRLADDAESVGEVPDDLLKLEGVLRDMETAPLTATASSRLMADLNDSIDRLEQQAHGWNRFGIRYGISLAAILLLVGISMMSLGPVDYYSADVNYLTRVYYEEMDSVSTEILGAEYFDNVVNAYLWHNGTGTIDEVVGDLTTEEYEYLKNNLQVGDIL